MTMGYGNEMFLFSNASTGRRLVYALQQLRPKEQKYVLWIVFNAIGLESVSNPYNYGFTIHGTRYPLIKEDDYKYILQALAIELGKKHDIDGHIMWLSMQFKKGMTSTEEQEILRRFRAVSIWASETRTDLGKLSAKDALNYSAEYTPRAERRALKLKDGGERSPIVMQFPDGWCIRQLKTDDALKAEGDTQGICVGQDEYLLRVRAGESEIYSLRAGVDSSRTNPRKVTIEVVRVYGKKRAKQIYGRENSTPKPEWQKYLFAFIDRFLDGDVVSKVLATGKSIAKAGLTDEEFASLADDKDWEVRQEVGRNCNTPPYVLDFMAFDDNDAVRISVAHNPNTTTRTLNQLSSDEDLYVRWSVIDNPNTPLSTLEQLAKSDNRTLQCQAVCAIEDRKYNRSR